MTETHELRVSFLEQIKTQAKKAELFVYYDESFDAISFQLVPPDVPTIVHYVDDDLGFLYKEDLEIVGIQLENVNFQQVETRFPDSRWGKASYDVDKGFEMTLFWFASVLLKVYDLAIQDSEMHIFDKVPEELSHLNLVYA